MPTSGNRSNLTAALADIKLAHSVFALPFAIAAAFLAAPTRPADNTIDWGVFAPPLVLIIICMVLARTWAMLVNRLADRDIDAANTRTARRAFASGDVPINFGLALALLCAIAFVAAASLFFFLFDNPFPPLLSIPLLAWIALYSFTKRFTFLAHLFLGSALALSPIATAIALNPDLAFSPLANPTAQAIYLLAAFVMFWVAGFDIAYALQDLDFDRSANLHSIPARFGSANALRIARLFHAFALLCLFFSWRSAPALEAITLTAVVAVALLVIAEHIVLIRRGLAGLPIAFFTINGFAALIFGLAVCIDVLL
jgi:4-hydroxybenzoate polyprenyltransferase